MILFLDTISSLPEFSLIGDNKLVYSKKIIHSSHEKMSDSLIQSYVDLDQKFLLNSKLEKLIINTGPGSYTSLRIGIAFFSGLSLSKKIDLKSITCIDLFKYLIPDQELTTTAIYINSSNNQNFFCLYDQKNNIYHISKIEKKLNSLYIENLPIKKIISNIELKRN